MITDRASDAVFAHDKTKTHIAILCSLPLRGRGVITD